MQQNFHLLFLITQFIETFPKEMNFSKNSKQSGVNLSPFCIFC